LAGNNGISLNFVPGGGDKIDQDSDVDFQRRGDHAAKQYDAYATMDSDMKKKLGMGTADYTTTYMPNG